MMLNLSKDVYKTGICAMILGFSNNFIPHGAEVVLQFRTDSKTEFDDKVCTKKAISCPRIDHATHSGISFTIADL